MNRQAVAQELVKVARLLTADTGDVPVFFNVFEMFLTTTGKWTAKQQEVAKRELQDAAYANRRQFEKMTQETIRKSHVQALAKAGVELRFP